MNPIDFAYERFGRFVAPEGRAEWLRSPSLQRKRLGKGKGTLLISESRVFVLGKADYTGFGLPPDVEDREERSRILAQHIFFSPTQAWLAVSFTGAAVDPSTLHLNLPGDQTCVYYSGQAKTWVRVRHADARSIGDALLDLEVPSRKAWRYLTIGLNAAAGMIRPDSAEQREYEKARLAVPRLPVLAESMARAGLNPSLVSQYMAHREESLEISHG